MRNYIKGEKRGKQARDLELEAMSDPFLADALDGYEKTKGDHNTTLIELEKRINKRIKPQTRSRHWWYAAAVLLPLLITSIWFMRQEQLFKEYLLAQEALYLEESTLIALAAQDTIDIVLIEPVLSARRTLSGTSFEVIDDTPQRTALAPTQEKNKRSHAMSTSASSTEEATLFAETTHTEDEQRAKEPSPSSPEKMASAAHDDKGTIMHGSNIETKKVQVEIQTLKSEPIIGWKAYQSYLQVRTPITDGRDCPPTGKVIILFDVSDAGIPINIRIKEGLCPTYDAKAFLLIKEGSLWTKAEFDVQVEVFFKE